MDQTVIMNDIEKESSKSSHNPMQVPLIKVHGTPTKWEYNNQNSETCDPVAGKNELLTISPKKPCSHSKFCEIVNSFKYSLQKQYSEELEEEVSSCNKRSLEDAESSPFKVAKMAKLSVSSCVCHLDYGRRSPCSDNYSVVANCASDLSDFSDDDFGQFSEDEFERQFEESVYVDDAKQ